ncbi:hypothetical protein G9C85_00250 [Halorubellus sp. JP-L1]|uniref:hypothetical protein n=1 Tax=Halorubellus sp. JP-L1 TaxID=2715753 RepID=UPI00140B8A53|nr:hypothetical protein [Halorubellus sp. JP-L1]NHN40069.1 hypothetical protein [Halorubellus sp. JP-L1]
MKCYDLQGFEALASTRAEPDDEQRLLADGGFDNSGPHANPHDEHLEWWRDDGLVVRGHRVTVACKCSTEMDFDGLYGFGGTDAHFDCPDCDGAVTLTPTPANPAKWNVFAEGCQETEYVGRDDDHSDEAYQYALVDDASTYAISSPTFQYADHEIVTDGGQEPNPLDRLFVDDVTERPDRVVVDEVTTMDASEFVGRLKALGRAAEAVEALANDLERLRQTGLTDDDARDLIYGRNNGIPKRDIEAVFDAIDALADGHTKRDPTERLLSDVSGLSLSETSDLMEELDALRRKYGDVANDGGRA